MIEIARSLRGRARALMLLPLLTAAAGGCGLDTAPAYGGGGGSGSVDAGPPPIAYPDQYSYPVGGPLVVTSAEGVLTNDDIHGVGYAARLANVAGASPLHGTVVLQPDGAFTYQADEEQVLACTDSFLYQIWQSPHQPSEPALVHLRSQAFGCQIFLWPAYPIEPHVYRGCPEPGPEPWSDTPRIAVAPTTRTLAVALESIAPLTIEVLTSPRNGRLTATADGFTFAPTTIEAMADRGAVRITSGACSYVAEADFVTGG